MNWDREEDHLATPAEAVAEFAPQHRDEIPGPRVAAPRLGCLGANPHYVGPPVPHPEADEPWDTDGDTSKWNENGEASEAENDRYASRANPGDAAGYDDDEIPF